jgi:hypothetical protein
MVRLDRAPHVIHARTSDPGDDLQGTRANEQPGEQNSDCPARFCRVRIGSSGTIRLQFAMNRTSLQTRAREQMLLVADRRRRTDSRTARNRTKVKYTGVQRQEHVVLLSKRKSPVDHDDEGEKENGVCGMAKHWFVRVM